MTNNNSSSWLGLAAAAFLTLAGNANAVTFSFTNISSNSGASASQVASQLTVDVEDAGSNQVSFTFRNAVGIASSITDIYFDDGTLLGIASVTNSGGGVSFSEGASPGDLPGGNAVDFNNSGGFFSADSNSPAAPNGVDSSTEWVRILFNLTNGQDFDDTIAAMNLSLANPGVDVLGGLRIGLHVQAIGAQSDAFVNTGTERPGQSVPDGGTTLVLLGSAMAGLGFIMRKSSKK
jgi:hypothetical protein